MHFLDLRAANASRDREWVSPGQALSLSFRGNELAGEIGEACNVLKKLERERLGLVGSRATLDDLAEELADGVICIDLIAMDTGIDLGPAVERKFNKTSVSRGLATRLSTSTAICDVLTERRRQVDDLDWTPAHDDEHADGAIVSADWGALQRVEFAAAEGPSGSLYRESLVKSAALLIAEIERIDRAEGRGR